MRCRNTHVVKNELLRWFTDLAVRHVLKEQGGLRRFATETKSLAEVASPMLELAFRNGMILFRFGTGRLPFR
jgi:hypothetical protein